MALITFLYERFILWKLWAQFWAPPVPTWGKVLAHVENAACPTRASVLPIFSSFVILAKDCGLVICIFAL